MQRVSTDSARPIGYTRKVARWLASIAVLLAIAVLPGCSLISFKSPERPLSDRDMNARILTRELTTNFLAASTRNTDTILAVETDPVIIEHTLRWELGVIESSRQAEMQLAPLMSLLDTWTLALQLQGFLSEGRPGGKLFGKHQAGLRAITDEYADGAHTLARSLLSSKEFTEYQSFVTSYVQTHPVMDLRFARPSVLTEWTRQKGAQTNLLDAVGTISQALADTSQRLEIYGDTVPQQAMRRTQLVLHDSGYEASDVRAALVRLDGRLERLTTVAEGSPELVREAEAELRASLQELFDRLDASTRATGAMVHREREALFADVERERLALLAAVDVQRRALTADAGRIADQLVRTSGNEVRRFTRQAAVLGIVFYLVLLGLPFAAGYFLGRARSRLHLG
jgi:hypothetical protein